LKKQFIVDTSVILYDKNSITSFTGHDVCLPITVLDELDRFKDKQGLLGEYARSVIRYLDNLRTLGKLDEGVYDPDNDVTIKILISEPSLEAEKLGLCPLSGDNRIISSAIELQKESSRELIVITKDINLRVKCNSIGIEAEDYYKDHLPERLEEDLKSNIITVTSQDISELYEHGSLESGNLISDAHENKFAALRSPDGSSALSVFQKGSWNLVREQEIKAYGIKARNKEQSFALHALRSNIPLVCLTGIAGSGKTFLALMASLEGLNERKYERIVLTRPIQTVGKDIGFLPGDMKEKMSPWLSPVIDNFRHAFKDVTYFEAMVAKGNIEVAPLPYIRGRTFSDCIIIVDEAQNATVHELKTVITRTGNNSKIVLLGDTDQIDTPYIDKRSNGLSIVSEKLSSSSLTASIHLCRGERSELATLVANSL
jgi:PhoH-like ATPase